MYLPTYYQAEVVDSSHMTWTKTDYNFEDFGLALLTFIKSLDYGYGIHETWLILDLRQMT